MSEWSKAQEADFQALVHRASEQSRECYRRRMDEPAEPLRVEQPRHDPPKHDKHDATPAVPCMPALPCLVQGTPPTPAVEKKPNKPRKETQSKAQTAARSGGKAATGGVQGGLKALTDKLDNEGIMLAMLLWLLIEEKADNTIILAVAYILLV